ncbi:MAG: Ldh family oxidoreductase [Gammaproteobacteria bacterium]|nr:Ldh family oxidoreductase [Gammaproteobacteria bacterium]
MSAYPGAEKEKRIALESLETLVEAVFEACGMQADDARLLAATLASADLRGVHSHGSMRVPDYVAKLTRKGVDPRGRPRVARDERAALVVDGGNAMGQIAADFAMRHAIQRAADTGVAFAAIGNSNHCGAMAWYAMQALEHDMIGLAATNALPTMAPWGGAERLVGINPLAVAMPTASGAPFVLDTAFSGSAMGKIAVYKQKGAPIPEDWALDSQGRPTTDAAAAMHGLLRPIGGFKGVGLAMVMGILSTLLSGAAYGTRLGDLVDGPLPGRDGHFVMALDIAAFTDVAGFKNEMNALVEQLRACRKSPGADRIYSPGELEHETAQRYRADGIPLNDTTLDGIAEAGRALGVDVSVISEL